MTEHTSITMNSANIIETGLWTRVYADSVQAERNLSASERGIAESLAAQAADRAVILLRDRTNPARSEAQTG